MVTSVIILFGIDKMKIINIKHRSRFIRFFTINEWNVFVQDNNGEVKLYQCWAGVRNPSGDHLLWDLKRKINQKNIVECNLNLNDLIGKEI